MVNTALIKMSPVGLRVKLLSPGSEPRQQLRLHLVKGSVYDSSMTFNLSIGITIGGNTLPDTALPAFTMGMRTVVSDVTPNGSTVDFTFNKVDVASGANPTVATAMKNAAKNLVGLHARTTVDDRGTVLAAGVESTSNDAQTQQLIAQFKQQAGSLSIPLPEEAVGKGARWTVSAPVALQGVRETANVTYVLQDVTGTAVNMQIITKAIVPDQNAAIPGLPSNVSAHVLKTTLNGGGLVATDLTQPMPTTFDQVGSGTIIVDVKQGTEQQRLLEKISIDVKISSTKA